MEVGDYIIGLIIGTILGAVATWSVFIKELIPYTIKKLDKDGYIKIIKPMKD